MRQHEIHYQIFNKIIGKISLPNGQELEEGTGSQEAKANGIEGETEPQHQQVLPLTIKFVSANEFL